MGATHSLDYKIYKAFRSLFISFDYRHLLQEDMKPKLLSALCSARLWSLNVFGQLLSR